MSEYVIWSIEHQAWWPASRMGYVETLAQAGRFSEREAREIVERANYPKAGVFNECMIPVGAVPEWVDGDEVALLAALPPRSRKAIVGLMRAMLRINIDEP